METIYSKIESNKILHIIRRLSDIEQQEDFRYNITETDNFLQCASLKMDRGKTFKPHKHIISKRISDECIAQESWIVIKGSIKCILYDLDDTILAEPILFPGDASFTLYGGHNYLILEDGTIVNEYKTGPYFGQEFDKKFI